MHFLAHSLFLFSSILLQICTTCSVAISCIIFRNVETASISQLNDVNPSTGLTYTQYSASWFTYISFTFKQYFYVCLSNYDVMFSTLLWSHWRHAFMGIHRFEYIQIFIVDVFVFMNFCHRIAVAGKTKNKC